MKCSSDWWKLPQCIYVRGEKHSGGIRLRQFSEGCVMWRDFLIEGFGLIYNLEFRGRKGISPLFGSGSVWSWFFILILDFHNQPSNDDFLIFFLYAVLTVYVRELTFSFGNSASSKPPLTTGHRSYGPSGDASDRWAKMVVSLPKFFSSF